MTRAARRALVSLARDDYKPTLVGNDGYSWDDLRYLEALGRLGTAGRAARELGASASTVYRRIAQLEKALGVSCVQSGGGRLTDVGEALAQVARQTDDALNEVKNLVQSDVQALAGEVSLTTVEGVIPFLAGPLARVMAAHPALTLRLDIGDHGPSVRRREVDIAVGVMPSPPESLWGRRLFTIRNRVFGTAAARAAEPRRWVVSGEALKSTSRAAWERAHVTHAVVRSDSLPTMLRFVHEGVGVAVLPQRLARLDPTLDEVESFRPSLEPLDRSAWLLTHPELRSVQRVRVVMDALLDAFEVDR